VRFVDERFEGRQEWVPPARLKVPWAAVGVFREREARWDRIDKLGIGDEPVSRAAEEVFEALIDTTLPASSTGRRVWRCRCWPALR
jgi:hypothetical protein